MNDQLQIAIDVQATMGQKTGVGVYVDGLLRGLQRVDLINDYVLFYFPSGQTDTSETSLLSGANMTLKSGKLPRKAAAGLFKLGLLPPLDMLFGRRLYFFPNFVRYPLLRAKSIITVHDLAFLHYPEFVQPKNLTYLKQFVPRSIAKADHVIAVSEATKRDITQQFDIPRERVSIVNPAVEHTVYKPQANSDIAKVKNQYRIDGDYILFTGSIEPRKNLIGLLDAYQRLPSGLRQRYTLVLAGGGGWLNDSIYEKIDQLKTRGEKIITTGYVTDEELPMLYSGATLFVLPSHFEGFGIPVLEAMACGCPVIAANNSSLPEVVGDAGVLVDADSSDELSQAMRRVLEDEGLRTKLQKQGFDQAQEFSWDKSAQQLVKVFGEVGQA